MWISRSHSGKSDKDAKDERKTRSKRGTDSSASVVSSSSARKPTRSASASESKGTSARNSISSYATAYTTGNDDLYDDPRDERRDRGSKSEVGGSLGKEERRRDREERASKSEVGGRTDSKRDKDRKERKSSSSTSGARKERSGSVTQPSYRGEIVDSPRAERSVYGEIPTTGPVMSGALPAVPSATISSHVPNQFPNQVPAHFTAPMPGISQIHSFGAAADYYGDTGQSVQNQPGVRIEKPSVIVPHDTPHLVSASSTANPVADTGTGAAADFYGPANIDAIPSMPGAFTEDEPAPQKLPRPSSSKPTKPGKLDSAAAMAGGAALGYAMGYNPNTQQPSSHVNGLQGASASHFYQGNNTSFAATEGSGIPTYSEAMEGAPPPKPPRPGKPQKQPSGSSNHGLYAAGAAGAAAYALHNHHSHHHSSSMPGGFSGDQYQNGGIGSSSNPFVSGGMAQRHEQKGPISQLVHWWKDHEDVQRMEEYSEFIGVCRGCFDPRTSVSDAPRKHHYPHRKRSNEFRPSGVEKQTRYGLSKKSSRDTLSGDDKKYKSDKKAGWLAAGLSGVGLAQAGKALFGQNRDFDDTYSIKSGHSAHTTVSRRRSHSRDRTRGSTGRSEYQRRSTSRDRASRVSVGVTNDRRDQKFVRRHPHSQSRSHSRDRKSGSGLFGAAIGTGLAASAVSASRRSRRSRSRDRSHSPQQIFVHHRRDSSDHDRRRSRHSATKRPGNKSSRSSIGSSSSIIDISHKPQTQSSGFLGGFFSPPPPKETRRTSHSRPRKKKGLFNFGNGSSSSSEGLAFGDGYVMKRKRPSRRNSDEKFNATLLALGATTAAIAASQAGRSKHGSKRSEVMAARDNRHRRRSRDRPRLGASSRYVDDEADGWEDLPDDDTSDSGSVSSGLAFGDYNLKKTKSQESLSSNGSGTNKWFWRWGSKKTKKQPSNENLYNAGSNSSFVVPAVAGAATAAAIGAGLSRHDSSASSVATQH